jgi:hypothetical protein
LPPLSRRLRLQPRKSDAQGGTLDKIGKLSKKSVVDGRQNNAAALK